MNVEFGYVVRLNSGGYYSNSCKVESENNAHFFPIKLNGDCNHIRAYDSAALMAGKSGMVVRAIRKDGVVRAIE